MSFHRDLTELRSRLDVDEKIKLAALHDVVTDAWGVVDVLTDSASIADELTDAILTQHREFHTEASPKFCTPICQLAAAL